MDRKITTAVIALAGWGTRWLPLTKSVEKCMLPVGTRPVVDWAVEDCMKAGITRIIFVVSEESQQIRQYFSHNAALNSYLTEKGKLKALEKVRQPQYESITFEYKVQPKETYGTAIPVVIAAPDIGPDESFVYLMGDDFLYRPDGGSEIADMITQWQESGAEGALMTKVVPREEAPKYGVVVTNEVDEFTEIREKPSLEQLADVPNPSINLGKYIISPSMLRLTTAHVAEPSQNHDGEYYITDIFGEAASLGEHIKVHYVIGEHLDAGTPANWLKANQRVFEQA